MKKEITLHEAVSLSKAISALDSIKDCVLPLSTQFKLALTFKSLDPVVKTFEEKHRDLIKSLSKEPDSSGNYTVLTENLSKFQSSIVSILELKVEVDLQTLDLSSLKKPTGEDNQFSQVILQALLPLFS